MHDSGRRGRDRRSRQAPLRPWTASAATSGDPCAAATPAPRQSPQPPRRPPRLAQHSKIAVPRPAGAVGWLPVGPVGRGLGRWGVGRGGPGWILERHAATRRANFPRSRFERRSGRRRGLGSAGRVWVGPVLASGGAVRAGSWNDTPRHADPTFQDRGSRAGPGSRRARLGWWGVGREFSWPILARHLVSGWRGCGGVTFHDLRGESQVVGISGRGW
jgi:hypothetical protein